MTRSPRRIARAIIALAVLALAAPTTSGALEPCDTPGLWAPSAHDVDFNDPTNPVYSPEDRVELEWFGGHNGGWVVEHATTSDFSDAVAESYAVTTREFNDLDERAYFWRVKAKKKSNVCTESAWSNVVTVIQDATAPEVAFSTRSEDLCDVVPVSPPQPVFCMEDEVRLEGTATDEPGGNAPSGSGAAAVVVSLFNTTPGLGGGEPTIETAQINRSDRSWLIRLKGDDKPSTGTYRVFAQAMDFVGNFASEPSELGVIVIL